MKHIDIPTIVGVYVMGMLMSYLCWGQFHYAGFLLSTLLLFALELFFQVRWRSSIRCKTCGFDPIVHKRSHSQAAGEVKAFLKKRKDDPSYMLRPQPKIKPRKKTEDSAIQSASRKRKRNSTFESVV